MSSKIKLKATYGGYKVVAQNGANAWEQSQYYEGTPPFVPEQPAQPVPIQQEPTRGGFMGKITGALETGVNAYETFIQGKRKLANQINNGISIASGVAGIFNEAQQRRAEKEQMIQSLQGTPYENSNRGMNNIPAYTKYGGDVQKMKNGGTSKVREYQQMLNDKYNAGLTVDGAWGKNTQAAYEKFISSQAEASSTTKPFDPFRKRQDHSNFVNKPSEPNLPSDAREIYNEQQFRGNPYSIVSKKDERIYNFDADGNLVLQDEVGIGKDKGDFANIAFTQGKQTTPAGEYRIRPRTGAVPADKSRKGYDANNFYEIEHTDPNLRVKGSPTNPKYANVTAAIHGLPTNVKEERLKALNSPNISNRMSSGCVNCRKETLNNPFFEDLDESKYRLFVTPESNKKQNGGYGTNVEAEQGEVFDNGGDILKIDGSAPTHEQGGVDIQADRVLENTSGMRKDPMSKALKLDKDQVSLLSGFKAKRGMSHSDAYEFEAKKTAELQEKTLKAIASTVENKSTDKYAIESAKLNVDLGLASLPSENVIFDKYFEHQESVKEDMGYYDGKLQAKYGKAQDGYVNPYRKGKTKTPTGKNSNFPGSNEDWQAYREVWQDNLGKQYSDDYGGTYDMQYDAYTWSLENDPESVRNMWKTYGLNAKAKQNGVKFDTNNLTDDQLKALRNEYVDGLSGVRMLQPKFDNGRIGPIDPLKPRGTVELDTPNSVMTRTPSVPTTTAPTAAPSTPVTDSEFNQPLEWYDTIGPAATMLSALRRDPELYNPQNIAQIKLQQQDVRPALNNSQAEYNAAQQNLGNDSIGAAQKAQLFSNKLRQDNQVIGQYENANKQIQNQETQYNANARDRQEAANAQAREKFYTNVLQGRAKQEEQFLTGLDSMAKTFAENRAFNRNANLIMKLAPNFNEKGNYNGKQTVFGQGSGNTQQPQVNEKGQYLIQTTDANGKKIDKWVDKGVYDQTVKKPSAERIQSEMIMNMFKNKNRR